MNRKLLVTCAALALLSEVSQAAVTWFFSGTIPDNKKAAITDAMNTAVNNYNTWANFTANVAVTYNSGVPTAQANYLTQIDFGGSISARVAQHELGHYFGCGTYWDWNNHRSNGQWTGANAIAKLRSYDGSSAILNCDAQHFWPYGWNQDNEGPADRNIGMVCALREDMGLSSGRLSNYIANGTYKIIARHSGKALDALNASTANGSKTVQWTYTGQSNQKWTFTQLGRGVYRIVGLQSGRDLEVAGQSTADGATVDIYDDWGGDNQKWYVAPGVDSGYYKLINVKSGKALDVYNAATTDGANVVQWGEGSGQNQQWSIAKP